MVVMFFMATQLELHNLTSDIPEKSFGDADQTEETETNVTEPLQNSTRISRTQFWRDVLLTDEKLGVFQHIHMSDRLYSEPFTDAEEAASLIFFNYCEAGDQDSDFLIAEKLLNPLEAGSNVFHQKCTRLQRVHPERDYNIGNDISKTKVTVALCRDDISEDTKGLAVTTVGSPRRGAGVQRAFKFSAS